MEIMSVKKSSYKIEGIGEKTEFKKMNMLS